MDIWLHQIGLFAGPALFNLYFAAASIPLGFVLAVLVALGRNSANPLLSRFCGLYIYAFRGSPLFIQFFMFYSIMLALNMSVWKPWGVSGFVLHPLFLGPMVLALNTTAYSAEIFHGALRTVPRGEVEAARAYGMSGVQQFRHIIWPHLIRIAWPAYTNEVVFLFHATALVYLALPVVGDQQDLMATAKGLFERDYNAFLHFSVAALWFLMVSLTVFFVFGLIYRRLMRHTTSSIQKMRFAPKWIR